MQTTNLTEGKYFGDSVMSTRSDWISASITDYDPETYIHPHTHENAYLSILLRGTYLEEGTHVSAGITPGEVLFRPAGYEHENAFHQQGGRCFNIELGADFSQYSSLPPPDKFQLYKKGTFPFLFKLYFSWTRHWDNLHLEESVIHWLADINQTEPTKTSQHWVRKVQRILDFELHTFHSLADLSERVYVHPVYLARGFKERMGRTIGEYQLSRKLESAFKMLLDTKASVSSIAQQNGFFDDAHFVRSFKSSYGRSPHQFRKELRS